VTTAPRRHARRISAPSRAERALASCVGGAPQRQGDGEHADEQRVEPGQDAEHEGLAQRRGGGDDAQRQQQGGGLREVVSLDVDVSRAASLNLPGPLPRCDGCAKRIAPVESRRVG